MNMMVPKEVLIILLMTAGLMLETAAAGDNSTISMFWEKTTISEAKNVSTNHTTSVAGMDGAIASTSSTENLTVHHLSNQTTDISTETFPKKHNDKTADPNQKITSKTPAEITQNHTNYMAAYLEAANLTNMTDLIMGKFTKNSNFNLTNLSIQTKQHQYTTICTWNPPTVIELYSGEVYGFLSPNHPQYLPSFSDCRFTFIAPKDHMLVLTCEVIDLVWFSGFSYTDNGEWIDHGCCIFCGGQFGLYHEFVSQITDIRFTNWLFTSKGYNCYIEARPKSCKCGAYGAATKMVGGTESRPHSYGWMALIVRTGKYDNLCGASLIAPGWLLTAAHCTRPFLASQLQVRLGVHDKWITSTSEVRRNVLQIISHPNYNTKNYDYDFALLRIKEVVLMGYSHIVPVCLASGSKTFAGQAATIAGWGNAVLEGPNSNTQLEAEVRVTTQEVCALRNGAASITPRMMCAYAEGKDTCQGDSGGPLVVKGTVAVQIGVVSWGRGCALTGYPGVYSRITDQRQWIDSYVGKSCTPYGDAKWQLHT